jgi:hypothetical protein
MLHSVYLSIAAWSTLQVFQDVFSSDLVYNTGLIQKAVGSKVLFNLVLSTYDEYLPTFQGKVLH